MQIDVSESKGDMGKRAAARGAQVIRETLTRQGRASIIVATGASQFEMLASLVSEPDIAWDRVTVFHLDEYVGLPFNHPASFRKYLWQRFHSRLPMPVKDFHYINAEQDAQSECQRIGAIIQDHVVTAAFIGIGENGHIAFNDPPADFEADEPYLVVGLDDACRTQQVGEGWFGSLDEVPRRAVTMSVRQIMKSESIICTVPDERKAKAVLAAVEGDVTRLAPASILQRHPDCHLYLDTSAASLLTLTDKAFSS